MQRDVRNNYVCQLAAFLLIEVNSSPTAVFLFDLCNICCKIFFKPRCMYFRLMNSSATSISLNLEVPAPVSVSCYFLWGIFRFPLLPPGKYMFYNSLWLFVLHPYRLSIITFLQSDGNPVLRYGTQAMKFRITVSEFRFVTEALKWTCKILKINQNDWMTERPYLNRAVHCRNGLPHWQNAGRHPNFVSRYETKPETAVGQVVRQVNHDCKARIASI